jgi:hypothetical protein
MPSGANGRRDYEVTAERAGDGIEVKPTLTPNPDGSIGANVAVLRRGQPRVEAGLTLKGDSGWRFHPEDPTLTVQTPAGPVRLAAPQARSLPEVTLNPDGTAPSSSRSSTAPASTSA